MDTIKMKVVMMGREYCGKTSVVERFLNERFAGENRYQSTIGAAYGAKTVMVEGKEVVMGIWDTAGSERYESMSRMYYRGSKAAVICYSVIDIKSWEKLKFWVAEMRKMEEDCKIYICATKTDLIEDNNKDSNVDHFTTTNYCEEIGAEMFETSSKTGRNISEMFQKIGSDYLASHENIEEHKEGMLEPNREFCLSDTPKETLTCCGGGSKNTKNS